MSILGDGLLPGHYPAGEVEPAGRGRRGSLLQPNEHVPIRRGTAERRGAVVWWSGCPFCINPACTLRTMLFPPTDTTVSPIPSSNWSAFHALLVWSRR